MAQQQDIGITTPPGPVFVGTTLTVTLTLTPPRDVTGWTTGVYFKKHAADSVVVKQYTPSVLSVSSGIFQIVMTKADTLLFVGPGTYVYTFERIDAGFEAVLTYGRMQFDRKVG